MYLNLIRLKIVELIHQTNNEVKVYQVLRISHTHFAAGLSIDFASSFRYTHVL